MAYKLLVIEDNTADAVLLRLSLEETKLHFSLVHVELLQAGIGYLYENEADLVFLDLTLPDSIGIRTLEKYIEKATDTPVIVLTGANDESLGISCVRSGAQDYLVKGAFTPRSLARSIEYSLQRFQSQQKLRETAKSLLIKDQRSRQVKDMVKFTDWTMDIVTYEMQWPEEMFILLGYKPFSFKPIQQDYLYCVRVEDRSRVAAFFEQAVKNRESTQIRHSLSINNLNRREVILRARLHQNEAANTIQLLGSIQDISDFNELDNGTHQKLKEQLILSDFASYSNLFANHLNLLESAIAMYDATSEIPVDLFATFGHQWKLQGDYLTGLFYNRVRELSSEQIDYPNLQNYLSDITKKLKHVAERLQAYGILKNEWSFSEKVQGTILSSGLSLELLYSLLINLLNQAKPVQSVIYTDLINKSNESSSLQISLQIKGKTPLNERNFYELSNHEDSIQRTLFCIKQLTEFIYKGHIHAQEKENDNLFVEIAVPIQVLDDFDQQNTPPPQATSNTVLLVEPHSISQFSIKKLFQQWSTTIQLIIIPNTNSLDELLKNHVFTMAFVDVKSMEGVLQTSSQQSFPIVKMVSAQTTGEANPILDNRIISTIQKPFDYQTLLSILKEHFK